MKRIFISEFIKQRKMVGAIAPSSVFLRKKMLARIDFSKDINIIELGPGTGIFTKGILKKMSPKSKLLSFELNPTFHLKLTNKIHDKRLNIINDSAENIKLHLKKHNIESVDVVVSSLPLTVIPDSIKNNIINSSYESLSENGMFVQFQYSLNAKKLLNSKFNFVDIVFSSLNIPPAFVYYCKK
jgi:phosphatidylethanolamine/phosphatidyl-N-methylethanolamine N-methyltransferase